MNIKAIDEISTSDLIDELCRRCNPAIFIGYKKEESGEMNTFWEYTCNKGVAYGLCHQMAFNVMSDMIKSKDEDE